MSPSAITRSGGSTAVRLKRIGSRPDDPLVPVFLHAEAVRGELSDRPTRLAVTYARAQDARAGNLLEQCRRPRLRLEQLSRPD